MARDIATTDPALRAQVDEVCHGFKPAEVELMWRKIKADTNGRATDQQVAEFVVRAHALGLNPLANQCYGILRGDKLTFQTGIDGFRAVGWASGQVTANEVELIHDREGFLVGARATIGRGACLVKRTALLSEFEQRTTTWTQYRTTMIEKCAEAKAWRAAFADRLSGVYIPEEMHPEPAQPEPRDVTPLPVQVEPRKVPKYPTPWAAAEAGDRPWLVKCIDAAEEKGLVDVAAEYRAALDSLDGTPVAEPEPAPAPLADATDAWWENLELDRVASIFASDNKLGAWREQHGRYPERLAELPGNLRAAVVMIATEGGFGPQGGE